jgi:hypothetical protein
VLAKSCALDALLGLLATTLLHAAAIDECATAAAADLDELFAAVGRLKQSNGLSERSVGGLGILTCASGELQQLRDGLLTQLSKSETMHMSASQVPHLCTLSHFKIASTIP